MGQHDLADRSLPGKSISYAYRCQRNVSAADIALAKKPGITESMQAIRKEQPYLRRRLWGQKSQFGDDPMNLPVELQRRLDRRWFARFGMSKQRSRPAPCAAMVRTVVKAQAPAVRARHPALEHAAPSSCSTRQVAISDQPLSQSGRQQTAGWWF